MTIIGKPIHFFVIGDKRWVTHFLKRTYFNERRQSSGSWRKNNFWREEKSYFRRKWCHCSADEKTEVSRGEQNGWEEGKEKRNQVWIEERKRINLKYVLWGGGRGSGDWLKDLVPRVNDLLININTIAFKYLLCQSACLRWASTKWFPILIISLFTRHTCCLHDIFFSSSISWHFFRDFS